MTSQTRAERQRVFAAYREVFTGEKARVRKQKVIRRILLSHRSSCKIPIGDSEIDNVVPILKDLLNGRVFESEEQASKEFPMLFQDDQLVKQDKVIEMASEVSGERNASLERSTKPEHTGMSNDLENLTRDTSRGSPVIEGICAVVRPLQFPFEAWHHILSDVQKLLEESCFNFTKKWLPSILKKQGWTCAAAVELTKWLDVVKRHAKDLPGGCMNTGGQATLKGITPAIAQLRHTVVHRLPLTSEEFLVQINSARVLADILQDIGSATKLQKLYVVVDIYVKEMENNTKAMQQEVDSTLFKIKRQKEELIQREQQFLSSIAKKQIGMPVATGQALVKSIHTLLAPDKQDIIVNKQSMVKCNENTMSTNYGVIVEEDDIESDEDHLQTELG
ncbi:hypothetical protein CC78DRAFT_571207 [Lojkania enalia]|uniref:Uncharacterized protein n=1 Tax=Lojkania enalia TaxID=147567 RepID=A0A9P4K020_9PLEO|nr:hypothetical protein CC78DRAFT_571207 [Didymosphaeria enalia]